MVFRVDESAAFKKNSVSRRREATCFFRVAFRVDETSTCKGTFLKSSVSRRREHLFLGVVRRLIGTAAPKPARRAEKKYCFA